MTEEEKYLYRIECRRALNDYIVQHGLDNESNDVILLHLPNMYRYLETLGLVKYGLTFEIFSTIAHNEYMFAELNRRF